MGSIDHGLALIINAVFGIFNKLLCTLIDGSNINQLMCKWFDIVFIHNIISYCYL